MIKEAGPTTINKTGLTGMAQLVERLRISVYQVFSQYHSLEEQNMAAGGEEGAIIMSTVDDCIYQLIQVLRDLFTEGMKAPTGLFSTGRPSNQLLSLFSEISLKNEFQQLLQLPAQLDPLFGEDSSHLEAAWFIDALNDVALPQYIRIIKDNPGLVKTYYDVEKSPLLNPIQSEMIFDLIHTLEKVYFQIDPTSYVDYYKQLRLRSFKNPSQTSVKAVHFVESEYEGQPSLTPQLESNHPSSNRPGSARSNGDSLSLRNPSLPSVKSPLRESITDLEDSEEIRYSPAPLSIDQSERTKGTVSSTRDTFLSSSETDLTTLTPSPQLESTSSLAPNQKNSILGLSLPFGFHPRSSVLGLKMDSLLLKLPKVNGKEARKPVPGDFELIDRIEEKEKIRLTCSASLFETRICPIKGLDFQHFKCHACQTTIGVNDYPDAKLCEVSGFYFCDECHIDDEAVSPALAVKNWDFRKVRVSKIMADLLSSLNRSELVDLESINPDLFEFIDELQRCKLLRVEIAAMFEQMKICDSKEKLALIRQVWPREHLVETINLYTVEDLLEAQANLLSRQLEDYRSQLIRHVRSGCPKCRHLNIDV